MKNFKNLAIILLIFSLNQINCAEIKQTKKLLDITEPVVKEMLDFFENLEQQKNEMIEGGYKPENVDKAYSDLKIIQIIIKNHCPKRLSCLRYTKETLLRDILYLRAQLDMMKKNANLKAENIEVVNRTPIKNLNKQFFLDEYREENDQEIVKKAKDLFESWKAKATIAAKAKTKKSPAG